MCEPPGVELPAGGTYEMTWVGNHEICYLHRLLQSEEVKSQCVPYPDAAQSLSVKPSVLQPQTSSGAHFWTCLSVLANYLLHLYMGFVVIISLGWY